MCGNYCMAVGGLSLALLILHPSHRPMVQGEMGVNGGYSLIFCSTSVKSPSMMITDEGTLSVLAVKNQNLLLFLVDFEEKLKVLSF